MLLSTAACAGTLLGGAGNPVPIRSALAALGEPDPHDVRWRNAVERFYAARHDAPAWSGPEGAERSAGLLRQLRAAGERGLRAQDYLHTLEPALATPGVLPQSPAAARQDVALTIAVAHFVSDLHFGRVSPREVGFDLDVPRRENDLAQALDGLASAAPADIDSLVDSFEPPFEHYRLLEQALARYQHLAASSAALTQLPPLPSKRAHIGLGDRYAGAARLRSLLRALGDLSDGGPASDAGLPAHAAAPDESPADLTGGVLDAALAAALARFQARHGIEPDGVLGAATLRALTTPLPQRVRQIELSLERWRWLPPKLDTPPVFVNIPEFRLFAFYTTRDSEQELLRMDVIVGRAFRRTQTPVFAADMRYVVLNPYWDVPRNIMLRELLPALRKDARWADAHGYELVRGPGDDARPVPVDAASIAELEAGRLRLRQRPGADNALGWVKFMLPNNHDVYLHSTPAQSLFRRARRDFSHGCVRVGDPMALFEYVLRNDPQWTRARAQEVVRSGVTTRIALRAPIRVYIVYATAMAAEDGRVLFFEDLYGNDARLGALLARR